MTRFGWMVVLGVVGLLVVALGLLFWLRHPAASVPVTQQATSTPAINPSSLSIYTSGEYGFSLFYPSTARITDAYSITTLSGISWRANAVGTGTPIVRIQKGDEELRVGIGTGASAVTSCMKRSPSEQAAGGFTLGSTTWQTFSSQKIGTDNEQQITSYRVVHARACYALDLYEPLGAPASTTSYTLRDTITSFSFAN